MNRGRGYLAALLLLGGTQGASYVFIRVAVRDLSPAVLMELRLLLAAIPLVLFFVARGRGGELRAAWRFALVLGLLNAAGPYLLIAWGEQHVDSGVAAVANAAVPIFVAVLAIKMLPSERVTGARLAGVLLGLAGVALLCGVDPSGGMPALIGTGAVVLSAALFAGAQLYIQRNIDVGGSVLATVGMAAGALMLLPFALVTLPDEPVSTAAIGSTLALGLISTLFAQLIFYWMLTWHGAARASLVTYTTPVFTLLFGAWFLSEPVTIGKTGGLALIIAGVGMGSGLVRRPNSLRWLSRSARSEGSP